jgi:dTDP-4-amino-4,6-dideoxy-D-galactose acyltransferase
MIREINFLKWDSACFGYAVGEVIISDLKRNEFEALYGECSNMGLKLCYIYPNDSFSVDVLIENNIKLVVNKVTFFRNLDISKVESQDNIRSYDHPNQFTTIKELAFNSGKYSRFKLDSNFRNNEFETLYTRWIENSIDRISADDVLVYILEGIIVGFVTYKIYNNKIVIGLIAVEEGYKGIGIGKGLMNQVENLAYKENKNLIEVTTQKENVNAVRFYQKIGYLEKKSLPVFHLWIS